LGTLALLTACGREAKQPALVEPKTDQAEPAKPTPPPSPTTTPAPSPTPAPAPKPATAPRPAAPSTPAPATQEAQQPKAPADAPQALIVNVGKANMREKPDAKAKILQVLTKGTKVVVVSKGNQWYRVRLSDGTEGWLAESVVTPAPIN
jgi:uncharacterized protein YgiM (DUF1202 family)